MLNITPYANNNSNNSEHKVVVVFEGEGAAPEAVRPTIELIDRFNLAIEWLYPPLGGDAISDHESSLPYQTQEAINYSDATFVGGISGRSTAALSYLRWSKSTYANVRPFRCLPGYNSPLKKAKNIDFAIVQDNLEDVHLAIEGNLEELADWNIQSPLSNRTLENIGAGGFALKIMSYANSEKLAHFAFELAARRKSIDYQGMLTVGAKHSLLPHTDGLFIEMAEFIARDYPDIKYERFLVDDLARRMVTNPQAFDVILLPYMYGEILTEVAAGLIGGLSLTASACYGDEYAYFETAQGSAPSIKGQNIINPTATLYSSALMLDYLGFGDAAAKLIDAIDAVYTFDQIRTPDQGGTATTSEFCDAVAEHI